MQRGDTIEFPQGILKVLTRAELQNCAAWKQALRNRCHDYRYYEIVEETLRQNEFEHRYLLLEDSSGRARAVQPAFFVRQSLVEGAPGTIRSIIDAIRTVFPRVLTMRVLMVGCAAGTGDLGACDVKDESWAANALRTSLRTYARRNKASLIVLKDFPASYRSMLETFLRNDYAQIPSMPMTQLSLRYKN